MECPALDQFRIRVSTLVLGNREIDQDPANDSWVAAGGLQRNGCSGAPAQQYEMLDSSRCLQEIHSLLRFPNGALLERKTIMAGRAVPHPREVKSKGHQGHRRHWLPNVTRNA